MLNIDTLTGLIAPHQCIGCGMEGSLLCMACVNDFYQSPVPRCAGCFKLSKDFKVCKSCKNWLPLEKILFAGLYEGINESLVKMCKFEYKRQALEPMAEMMSQIIKSYKSENTVLCPIPTAPSRVRLRGFDHTKILALKISEKVGMPTLKCLGRNSNNEQMGASRAKRIKQMEEEFYAKDEIAGKDLILVDDVMTTGATLAAASKVLKKAGAKSVNAVIFARKT